MKNYSPACRRRLSKHGFCPGAASCPDHKSILAELVRKYTQMDVFEVEDGMEVRPNCAYIIPPNKDMAFINGTLQLMEPSAPHGQRLPIDFFFKSLAQSLHERAACVILSGTGSDGTEGLSRIKAEGGMVIAQKPESADFDGMPRSAIATGLVDFVLSPKAMLSQLIAYVSHAFVDHPKHSVLQDADLENDINKIFVLLRNHTGHDFSLYKRNTVNRRIERRIAVNQIKTISEYVKFLQQTPSEIDDLLRDLLIGVTNFFRDPKAFAVLEKKVIPKLFKDKTAGSTIRVWTPGCSTGEEAYSIAILLQEQLDILKQNFKILVFATDIDGDAIANARAGRYPAGIAADISPARLSRFFAIEPDQSFYRVHKNIRDMLVFSEQNVIKDPPFSKLDLISCRNMLIYMNGELQKKLIPLFHYALNPGGILFLGASETVSENSNLFSVIDRKSKIYQRQDGPYEIIHRDQVPDLSGIVSVKKRSPRTKDLNSDSGLPLRELIEQAILKQAAPACALVNRDGDILYLHGHTGKFLELPPGKTGVNNILKMAREGLQRELTIALHKAASDATSVSCPAIRVKTNGDFSTVRLTVSPVEKMTKSRSEAQLYLVILNELTPVELEHIQQLALQDLVKNDSGIDVDVDTRITVLKRELETQEEYLRSANEELETTNEELKSSNEEMQSINEELQSTNEELETSKEELQSVNEELSTVNSELQTKVTDLSQVNNDMNNLLAASGIGTVFVDNELNIKRFTPAATRIINLIPGDIGRPIGHIVSNLVDYNRLEADAQSVLDTLVSVSVDLQTKSGKWYTMNIQPYRTMENVIDGVVITFFDITMAKDAQQALLAANEQLRLAVVARDAFDAITVQDLDGRIIAWNPMAEKTYGWSEAEAIGMNICAIIPEELQDEATNKVKELTENKACQPYKTQRLTKDGVNIKVMINPIVLIDNNGKMYAFASLERILS